MMRENDSVADEMVYDKYIVADLQFRFQLV